MKTTQSHPKNLRAAALTCSACLLGMFTPQSANSADFSDTEMNYQYGTRFREPFIPDNVTKNILTLQHFSAWKLGSNFFFVDFLQSNGADNNAAEVYGEWYSYWSLKKITGANAGDFSFGILRDLHLTGGINYGAKNTGVNPRVVLAGVTLDFDLPLITFFTVDVLAYFDRSQFKPDIGSTVPNCGGYGDTYQINPAWKWLFSLGPTKWSFEGHVDFIGSHGTCEAQILAQPQLRFDVGHYWGSPDVVYVGIELQYWKNKFGFKDLNETVPQFLFVWKF